MADAEQGAPPAAAPEAGASDPSSSSRTGRLVVVLAAKGGCGATLVAANLAGILARGARALLVDLDFCKGDVAGYLDLRAGRSVNLLLERTGALDGALLAGTVERHASGVDVLPQPYDLTDLREPNADEILAVLDLARKQYDVVVVDAGSRIDVASLTAVRLADVVILLATPDVPGLRDAQRVLGLFRRLDVAPEHVDLVLNGGGRSEVAEDDVVSQLKVPVALTLTSDDKTCARADATGELLADIAPRAPIVADLERLAALVRGEHLEPTHPRRFAWLLGR